MLTRIDNWMTDNPEKATLVKRAVSATHPLSVGDIPGVWEDLGKAIGVGGAAGGAVDCLISVLRAYGAYKGGHIDKTTFAKYVASETACGVASSGSGAGVTETLRRWTDVGSTVGTLAGIGASFCVRGLWRRLNLSPDIEFDSDDEPEFHAETLEEELNRLQDNDGGQE